MTDPVTTLHHKRWSHVCVWGLYVIGQISELWLSSRSSQNIIGGLLQVTNDFIFVIENKITSFTRQNSILNIEI